MPLKNLHLNDFRSVRASGPAARGPDSDFLTIFSLQLSGRIGDENREYRLEARWASLAASWRSLGIPQSARARRRETEPRLATAILQALNVTETT